MPGTPALDMLPVEVRYLFDGVADLRDLLSSKGQVRSYSSQTFYVDTADGTWSQDPSQPRFRLRRYKSALMEKGEITLNQSDWIAHYKAHPETTLATRDAQGKLIGGGASTPSRYVPEVTTDEEEPYAEEPLLSVIRAAGIKSLGDLNEEIAQIATQMPRDVAESLHEGRVMPAAQWIADRSRILGEESVTRIAQALTDMIGEDLNAAATRGPEFP